MANCTEEEVFAGTSWNCTEDVDVFADNSPWLVGFLVCCSVQGSAGNILILLAVATDKTLRSSTDAFIANVAVMDLMISGVLFPTMVPSLMLRRNAYAAACQVRGRQCVRRGGYVSGAEAMCQAMRQCVRRGGNVSGEEAMCQARRQCVRCGGNVSGDEAMCLVRRQCFRRGSSVSGAEAMCQVRRQCVR
jgi:hypothetical protein